MWMARNREDCLQIENRENVAGQDVSGQDVAIRNRVNPPLSGRTSLLILDDDEESSALTAFRIRKVFPEFDITTVSTPTPTAGFHVYLVDDDFCGQSMAARVAMKIRTLNPDAVIIAFSAHLDDTVLKTLINAGCDGAFDKGSPGEFGRLVGHLASLVKLRQSHPRRPCSTGLLATIQSINRLIANWNHRLELERDAKRMCETQKAQL